MQNSTLRSQIYLPIRPADLWDHRPNSKFAEEYTPDNEPDRPNKLWDQ